jgi:hypothetical protein
MGSRHIRGGPKPLGAGQQRAPEDGKKVIELVGNVVVAASPRIG